MTKGIFPIHQKNLSLILCSYQIALTKFIGDAVKIQDHVKCHRDNVVNKFIDAVCLVQKFEIFFRTIRNGTKCIFLTRKTY